MIRDIDLPNLLYVGDVPVEATCHGSALLYRLLENYPAEKLLIVEGSHFVSQADYRLGGVPYLRVPLELGRLRRTRYAAWYSSWLTLTAAFRARAIDRLLNGFIPEAILTVTQGHSWIAAARFASQHTIPLHLICHDDWPRYANVVKPMMAHVDTLHGAIYRQARSRFCVSPFMETEYRRRYGAAGTVLYPSRASSATVYPESIPTERDCVDRAFTVAFAGSVNSQGYREALKAMSDCVHQLRGRFLIFGTFSPDDARRTGIDKPTTQVCGMLPSPDLMRRLREEADVLFVPMSFEFEDRANMEISFPSKLTDYTAVGLPLLIFGPSYCSAVQWATQNPGAAEIVDENSVEALNLGVQHLASDEKRRRELGAHALALGSQYFSHEAANAVFQESLLENHRELQERLLATITTSN